MDIGKKLGLTYGASTRNAFGEALKELGTMDENIVVVDGDVGNSTRTNYFGKAFPDRFFNVGIAESNLVGVASGLAASGKNVFAASFAAFLLCNAYDQIRMGIAFPQVNVKLVGSHSGISIGEDGPSQMAIEDLALATALPNMIVVVPADAPTARAATLTVSAHEGPAYLRTGRPEAPIIYDDDPEFELGKANRLREGKDVTIIACGLMVSVALEAAHLLAEAEGIEARVLDMHTVKPLDTAAVVAAAKETGAIVTAEEHLLFGGLGSAVACAIAENHPVPMGFICVDDTYAESGEAQELLEKYRLMPSNVIAAVKHVIDLKVKLQTTK